MKPEVVVDADCGMVEQLGPDGLRRLMSQYSVWLLTARGEHRFKELNALLEEQGILLGKHYVGICNSVRPCVVAIISLRARTVEELSDGADSKTA